MTSRGTEMTTYIPWSEIEGTEIESYARWMDSEDWSALRRYYDTVYTVEGFSDCYVGTWEGQSETDAVAYWAECTEQCDISSIGRFARYFDWKSYANDLIQGGDVWAAPVWDRGFLGQYQIFYNR